MGTSIAPRTARQIGQPTRLCYLRSFRSQSITARGSGSSGRGGCGVSEGCTGCCGCGGACVLGGSGGRVGVSVVGRSRPRTSEGGACAERSRSRSDLVCTETLAQPLATAAIRRTITGQKWPNHHCIWQGTYGPHGRSVKGLPGPATSRIVSRFSSSTRDGVIQLGIQGRDPRLKGDPARARHGGPSLLPGAEKFTEYSRRRGRPLQRSDRSTARIRRTSLVPRSALGADAEES